MTRYVETFFRHKVLLCLPVVLTLLVGVWYVTSQPKKYTSTMTVWFDSQLPGPSSIDNTTFGGVSPSAQAQSLLTQLLNTQDFLVKVGKRGPMADYLRNHPATASLDDRIAAALTGAVSAWTIGPQVLRVTMVGSDPTVTSQTLTAVIAEYSDYVTTLRKTRDQASLDYYQPRLDAATQALNQAQQAQVAYVQQHPEAAITGSPDPQYAQLAVAVVNAQSQYTALQNSYSQVNEALTAADASSSSHVIDPPSQPVVVGGKKKAVFAGVAAVLFGLLLSVLGLTALTATDTAARRREDLEDSKDGLQVVATIEEFARTRQPRRARSS